MCSVVLMSSRQSGFRDEGSFFGVALRRCADTKRDSSANTGLGMTITAEQKVVSGKRMRHGAKPAIVRKRHVECGSLLPLFGTRAPSPKKAAASRRTPHAFPRATTGRACSAASP